GDSAAFLEQFAKPLCCNVAVDFAASQVEHQSLPLLAVRFQLDSVEPQEHDRSHHRSSFIPIDKRMVLTDVEQVSSGDFYDVGIGRFATKAGVRRQNCRRQQISVTHAVSAAKLFDYLGVNLANDVDAEMEAIVRRGVVSRHFPAALDRYLAASPA